MYSRGLDPAQVCRNLPFGFGYESVCNVFGHTQSKEPDLSKTRGGKRIPATVIFTSHLSHEHEQKHSLHVPRQNPEQFYKGIAKRWSRGGYSQLHCGK